jgi:trk system potassium uptake protein TrkH
MSLKQSYNEFFLFVTFLLLILAGWLLLKAPFVSYAGGISWLDALFMSTSAGCVTGLVTVPASGFNIWGQLTLLLLMQLGAIGIMTLATSVLLVLRGELSLYHRLHVAKITGSYSLGEIEGILALILKYTFYSEAIGFLFLSLGFLLEGFGLQQSLYSALFHTISAFCNAGFSTFDSSLMEMNPLIKATVACLIVLGGIGFYVIYDLIGYLREKSRITIHTRVVLWGTLGMIATGAFLLLAFEKNIAFVDAVFQSITARTAGFNTVDVAGLQNSSIFMLLGFMVIGAAPGSTGGGVKLTTFLVSILAVYNVVLGRNRIVIFGRKLPNANILRAYALIILYLSFLALETILLLGSEGARFMDTLFEVVSAVGTVGLSLGLTPELSPAGKIILIVGMFVGRIGPVALMLTFFLGEKESRIDYPEEKIILG